MCSYHQFNTNDNFVQFPIRVLRFILKKLKIAEFFKLNVKDPRPRVDDYELSSLLMFALSTHLFRSSSKNEFHLHLKRERASRALAKFNGFEKDRCPCPRTIDDVIIDLNDKDFLPILPAIFKFLIRQKIFQLHPEWTPNGEYAIAIDAQATHTYSDHSQHPCQSCPFCLRRQRGEKVWYLHLDLVASFIAPNGLQIPLLVHRIKARPEWGQLSDEEWKQECERTAFPLLLRELKYQFPYLRFCIHLDSLYPTDNNFSLLEELKMGYSIVRKAKVLKTVGEDCDGLLKFSHPTQIAKEAKRFKIKQSYRFFNNVAYRGHSLSIIRLEEHTEKKLSKRFAKVQSKDVHWEWIVHHKLTHENVAIIGEQSRIRWKQENLFNDLQHRGFAICHDFNRAPNSQSIRIYLILIAYAITSILTYSRFGQTILAKGYTISFIMKQMLLDLIYLNFDILFEGYNPIQLRFGKDPPSTI